MNLPNTIPAVEKSIAMLLYLSTHEFGATRTELATALGLTRSTCYRIMQTLLGADFIRKNESNRYELSNGLLPIARKITMATDRFSKMLPILEELAKDTGLCCKLSIRQGDSQLPILRAESPRLMSVSGKLGVRFPIIEGSVGAALLSDTPEAMVRLLALQCKVVVPESGNTELVMEGISQIKKNGYCFNPGKNRWNIDAMSVPVYGADKKVAAALTLLGSNEEFEEAGEARLAKRLLRAAKDCSSLLAASARMNRLSQR
ncbi:MAG: IclR family transcriptional regulator [Kiritimatiellia bacterium]